jgi:GNAT superfamily N-acetyltransferase
MGPGEFLRNQFHFYRLWILERSLRNDGVGTENHSPAAVELRFLDRHSRRDWICQHASDADWPQFRAALQHDHDLVVASAAGQALGWAWIGYERVHLTPLGRSILLPPGTGYLYEAYVRPAARRRGIGRALVGARCLCARQRGCDRLLTHVVEGNLPSLRALQAHGFAITGRTHFVKALVVRMWTRSPLPATLPAAGAAEPAAARAGV